MNEESQDRLEESEKFQMIEEQIIKINKGAVSFDHLPKEEAIENTKRQCRELLEYMRGIGYEQELADHIINLAKSNSINNDE